MKLNEENQKILDMFKKALEAAENHLTVMLNSREIRQELIDKGHDPNDERFDLVVRSIQNQRIFSGIKDAK